MGGTGGIVCFLFLGIFLWENFVLDHLFHVFHLYQKKIEGSNRR
jgi:hypothetical protein